MNQLEDRIAELIRMKGPLTGAELQDHLAGNSLALWQTCHTAKTLTTRTLGRQYLRLDPHVAGYARLSPSILREFFTYSVIGLANDPEPLKKRRQAIASRIETISREKHDMARRFIEDIHERFKGDWPEERLCVILAGDIVYHMAHRVPRPERSTGKLVDGSDIDLVVIAEDAVPDSVIEQIDDAILKSKYLALVTPSVREEIDYVVKKMARVEEQLQFDTFKRMVACKILHEGELLHGSAAMFDGIKARLRSRGIAQKLEELTMQAHTSREAGRQYLLGRGPAGPMDHDVRMLFYSADESEEFE